MMQEKMPLAMTHHLLDLLELDSRSTSWRDFRVISLKLLVINRSIFKVENLRLILIKIDFWTQWQMVAGGELHQVSISLIDS